jgi:nucleoside-diphosphate-sugar epimerase
MSMRYCVTGASGFVASHLCTRLKADGHWVRGVDIVEPRWGPLDVDEFVKCDLRHVYCATPVMGGIDAVFHLAATMGGVGFISIGANDLDILTQNMLIDLTVMEASAACGVERVFYSSSACTYPEHLQDRPLGVWLKETDAIPASPDTVYGWEKLFAEILMLQYGQAGREKLPAAACRKIAEAEHSGHYQVEIWGDGQAVRSFCHISDCLEMVMRLMESDYCLPMNVGTSHAVTVKGLYELVADIAGISDKIEWVHVDGPEGVRGRNADLRLMRSVLNYEPQVSLREALTELYGWVKGQV